MPNYESDKIKDLIRNPVESEGVELKSWIDLKDNEQKSKIAKHIAAISNFGGGYLIFGFNDDLTRCKPNENVRKDYSQDILGGIIDKYLHPKFQCKVRFVSHDDVEHAIVWIPCHGKSPVLTKKCSPASKDLKHDTIANTLYIRIPKPESKPISTPEEFEKLIRRCTLADKDELLRQISDIVSGSNQQPKEGPEEEIKQWHKATQNAFLAKIKGKKFTQMFPLSDNYAQYSYSIISEQKEHLLLNDVISILDKLTNEVSDTVHYGWSMFRKNMGTNSSPYPNIDRAYKEGSVEFLEANHIDLENYYKTDFWRISPEGKASLIRGFQEDCDKIPNASFSADQKYFDPWLHIRNITELVRHAKAFSNEFDGFTEIIFQVEYHGLKSRVLAPIDQKRHWPNHRCCKEVDDRNIVLSFRAGQLAGEMPKIVKYLYEPIHGGFDPSFKVAEEWIEHLIPSFIL